MFLFKSDLAVRAAEIIIKNPNSVNTLRDQKELDYTAVAIRQSHKTSQNRLFLYFLYNLIINLVHYSVITM